MSTTHDTLEVTPQLTPNPQSVRFELNRTLVAGPGYDFPNRAAAAGNPLVEALFTDDEVSGVFVGRDFVTVSVAPAVSPLAKSLHVEQVLQQHFASGQPAVVEVDPATGATQKTYTAIETKIMETLDLKVRPAVAMDGGDIVYAGFEDGVVKLELRGACAGCPSSMMTLKVGIENLLKEDFPDEVRSVEAV